MPSCLSSGPPPPPLFLTRPSWRSLLCPLSSLVPEIANTWAGVLGTSRSEYFACIISVSPHRHFLIELWLSTVFFRWENWELKKLVANQEHPTGQRVEPTLEPRDTRPLISHLSRTPHEHTKLSQALLSLCLLCPARPRQALFSFSLLYKWLPGFHCGSSLSPAFWTWSRHFQWLVATST